MGKGTVYFFTGLAGAGKTTVGGLFYLRLKAQNPDAVLLDGDQLRNAGIPAAASSANMPAQDDSRYTTEARKA